jgi:hypothetical protein
MGMSIKITDDLLGIEEYDIARKVGSKLTKNNDDLSHTVKPNETQIAGWKNSQMSMPSGLPASDLKMMDTLSKLPKLGIEAKLEV